jgi:hypothetical protein
VDAGNCAAVLLAGCGAGAIWQRAPLLLGLNPSGGNATAPFPALAQSVAAFLLMRGPYAYMGWGQWGMEWDASVALPQQLSADYGEPVGVCSQPSAGVFTRQWSNANVTLNCNTFTATIQQ